MSNTFRTHLEIAIKFGYDDVFRHLLKRFLSKTDYQNENILKTNGIFANIFLR